MIAREWKCLCPKENLQGFMEHLRRTGIEDTSATPGCRGHLVLDRTLEDCVEVVLLTFWESLEAIRGFAGEDPARAVLYPDDAVYGIVPEREVRHYQVGGNSLLAG